MKRDCSWQVQSQLLVIQSIMTFMSSAPKGTALSTLMLSHYNNPQTSSFSPPSYTAPANPQKKSFSLAFIMFRIISLLELDTYNCVSSTFMGTLCLPFVCLLSTFSDRNYLNSVKIYWKVLYDFLKNVTLNIRTTYVHCQIW